MNKICFNLFSDTRKYYEVYESKRKLFEMFFSDFYYFIKDNSNSKELIENNINSCDDFLKFADYYAGGMENCYSMGYSFYKYFLFPNKIIDVSLQSDKCFIGYCYKNKKYLEFIEFLIDFFAYWRNDEGCTTFEPYNYGDNFFASSWASLVDTCKLFYFSSETVYHWQSFRVKYCLDNIPGVIKYNNNDDIRICGYEFVSKNDNIYNFKRKDFYTYWKKEFETIPKEIIENYKKPDPL